MSDDEFIDLWRRLREELPDGGKTQLDRIERNSRKIDLINAEREARRWGDASKLNQAFANDSNAELVKLRGNLRIAMEDAERELVSRCSEVLRDNPSLRERLGKQLSRIGTINLGELGKLLRRALGGAILLAIVLGTFDSIAEAADAQAHLQSVGRLTDIVCRYHPTSSDTELPSSLIEWAKQDMDAFGSDAVGAGGWITVEIARAIAHAFGEHVSALSDSDRKSLCKQLKKASADSQVIRNR